MRVLHKLFFAANNIHFFLSFFLFFSVFISVSALSWAQSSLFWTGDGGRNTRVTVAEPAGAGLSAQEQVLLPLIQSTIIGSFQRFSAMTVFDRQNLENILQEQRLSMSGDFSETDYIRIGNLTNARLVVFGRITKISNNYMLELAVSDVENGERRASYLPRQVSLLALENLSAIREASADLLRQLGVTLTPSGMQELRRAEDTSRIQAENALARGITAQRQGTTAEAFTYFFQAATFDPSLMKEAVNRVSVLSAGISGGNLQNVRNRMQEHDDWQTIVNTANSFYNNHLPYELVYDTNIQHGAIDFAKRVTDLSIGLSLIPTDAWKTINDLRQGLGRARRNDAWSFNLSRIGPEQITVTMQILSENRTVISTASHTFRNMSETSRMNTILTFRDVKADDVSERLTVHVAAINEVTAQRAAATGLIQISPLTASASRGLRTGLAREEKREAKRKEMEKHPLRNIYFGAVLEGGYTIGTKVWVLGVGLIAGYKGISAEFDVLFYPGIMKDNISAYMGTSSDLSVFGFNLDLFYSFLNPKWHLSFGGGVTYIYSSGGSGEASSVSSSDSRSISAFVPNAQAWANLRFMDTFFFRVGYRCDFYPRYYGNFFTKPAAEPDNIFFGHSLMIGIVYAFSSN